MAVIGAASSPIKSIQRGTTQATTYSVTINAVDLGKSFVSCSFKSAYGGTDGISGAASLSSSTTIQMALGASVNYTNYPIVYWEVIEYV